MERQVPASRNRHGARGTGRGFLRLAGFALVLVLWVVYASIDDEDAAVTVTPGSSGTTLRVQRNSSRFYASRQRWSHAQQSAASIVTAAPLRRPDTVPFSPSSDITPLQSSSSPAALPSPPPRQQQHQQHRRPSSRPSSLSPLAPPSASRSVSPSASLSASPPPLPSALLVPLSDTPCPSVFLYGGLPLWGDDVAPRLLTEERAFGPPLASGAPGLRKTPQWSVAEEVIARLQTSAHCRLVRRPSEADLFLIPAFPSPKSGEDWGRICSQPGLWGPGGNASSSVTRYLPYLTERTAPRHLVIVPKGHYVVSKGENCAWLRGEGSPLLSRIQVFSYSHTLAGLPFAQRDMFREPPPVVPDGRVVSIPYPSSYHWSRALGRGDSSGSNSSGAVADTPAAYVPPWARFSHRDLGMFFAGKPHGMQTAVRLKILADCAALGEPRCNATQEFDEDFAMRQKQRAVFCLEPEGDSPFRKSVYDSLVSGCIPVLFSPHSDAVAPWHWGAFRTQSRVLLSADDYLRGTVDLAHALLGLPAEAVRAMQAAIAAHAQRLQFALDDMPGGDDAFEVLLKKAHRRAVGGVTLEELARW